MKTTEEIKEASTVLKGQIKQLIDEFVSTYGECNIDINTNVKFIDIAMGKAIYAEHEIEIYITI